VRMTDYRFEVGVTLVEVYARTGDLQAAEHLVQVLHALAYSHRRYWSHPWQRAAYESALAAAEATLLEIRGRFIEAERLWRDSLAALAGQSTPSGWLETRLDARTGKLAQCLLKHGRLLEAEVEARKALRSSVSREGAFGFEALSLLGVLARVLREQGRHAEAR